MWGSLSAALFVSVCLIPAVSPSRNQHPALPEDLEGSGYDLDSSGSGSGDGWEPDEAKVRPNSYGGRIFTANKGGGNKSALPGSSGVTSGGERGPATGDDYILIGASRRFWENEEILAVVIAGAVAGVVIAVVVSAVLIHKRQKKGEDGHILGRSRASDEDYQRPLRGAFMA